MVLGRIEKKYVCSMKGVVLTWDNLDEETKENLKGEPGKERARRYEWY